MISGDLNAPLNRLPTLFEQKIKSGALIDLGAGASRFGGFDLENTCNANPFPKATKCDDAIVNQAAYDLVASFKVYQNAGLVLRSMLHVGF